MSLVVVEWPGKRRPPLRSMSRRPAHVGVVPASGRGRAVRAASAWRTAWLARTRVLSGLPVRPVSAFSDPGFRAVAHAEGPGPRRRGPCGCTWGLEEPTGTPHRARAWRRLPWLLVHEEGASVPPWWPVEGLCSLS